MASIALRTVAQLQTYLQAIFHDTSTPTQTILQIAIDFVIKDVRAELDMNLDNESFSLTTVASQQGYSLPPAIRRIDSVKITSGGVDYYPKPLASRSQWDAITGGVSGNSTSDIPIYYTVYLNKLQIYPKPASSSNAIVIEAKVPPKDLETTDFTDNTAGTITLTNASAAVVGSATTFLSTDAGRYIQMSGDMEWYRILSFTSTTAITLGQTFAGTTAAGKAFRIGTVPRFMHRYPDAMSCVLYGVLAQLWASREEFSAQGGRATHYDLLYAKKLKELKQTVVNFDDESEVYYIEKNSILVNPNDYPTNLSA